MLNTIEEAIEDIKNNKIIIAVDADDREAEGDFICAAENVQAEHINFMVTYGRGWVCTALSSERVESLGLPMMVKNNACKFETAFTVTVEAREGTTTGISPKERALTSRTLANSKTQLSDFTMPGHSLPLKAKKGGVLERAGHTEATVDLARLAGLEPSGVLCEITNDDGTMARMPDLIKIAKKHNLKIIAIEDLIKYRRKNERLITMEANPHIPSKFGDFMAYGYRDHLTNQELIAFVHGEIDSDKPILVRVHSECLTGDIFGSKRCDCGQQLEASMIRIGKEGGVFLYMKGHEGRGIGLLNKMKAYELQEQGRDTVEANHDLGFAADQRNYEVSAQILYDLGVRKIRLLTNNPRKVEGLSGHGLEVVERVEIKFAANDENYAYLKTKQEKMGHILGML